MIELAPRSGNRFDVSFKDDCARRCIDDAEVGWERSVAEGDRGFGRVGSETELIDANV